MKKSFLSVVIAACGACFATEQAAPFDGLVYATGDSEAIRLETRDPDPMPESVDSSIAIKGGRILTDTVWDATTAATNFVLNTIVVPADVTLTIVTNSCVWFTPHTGIRVEPWGTLRVIGGQGEPAVFTASETGDWNLTVLEYGSFSDAYARFEKTTISSHPTVTLPAGCETSERNGIARIPVNLGGTRDDAFRVKWRTANGTATFGEDYGLAGGTIEWSSSSDGAKYIEIPITSDDVEEGDETFTVELYDAEGVNMGGNLLCTVLIRAAIVPTAVCTESEDSEEIRIETRDPDPMPAELDSSIAIEGGRLSSNTVWSAETFATNFVLNTVVVPSGVTLTVVTNAYVRFAPYTGVKVEPGGTLRTVGNQEQPVVFDAEALGDYSISILSDGNFSDTWTSFRNLQYGGFGTATVASSQIVDADEGTIRIPVYASGSRETTFSVDWEGSDGTSGTLVWNKASDGIKWIVLPVAGREEGFSVTLTEGRGINVSLTDAAIAVQVYESAAPRAVCAASADSDEVRFECRPATTLGYALVRGTEYMSDDGETAAVARDTTLVADGWQANGTLVRNASSITMEGGRISPDTNWWTAATTHLVRNWVVVPNGATLIIDAGTVVKFCEFTGIKVEPGGNVVVSGTDALPVVYTAAADDTIGGDSDLREREPEFNDYALNVLTGGTYSDSYCGFRYATLSGFGTVTLPKETVADLTTGLLRVPVFISTDRTTRFCVDWRVRGGAVAVNPSAAGRVVWANKNGGTQYIDLPMAAGSITDGFDDFEIELYESQGINVSTTARRCAVKVYSGDRFPNGMYAANADSTSTRIETREYDSDLELGASAGVALEAGRLPPVTNRWTAGSTHLVRNWVVVPDGVTLVIDAGAVVKFLPYTGIRVEPGGCLVADGTNTANIVFTSVSDDTVGGDTDGKAATPTHGNYSVAVLSGGTFLNKETQMRYGTSSTFGSIRIEAAAVARKEDGFVRIPVYVPSASAQTFSVDWAARDGVAKYGEDYLLSAGRLDWSASSTATKFISIPLDRMAATETNEAFTVELTFPRGVNLDLARVSCAVTLYDTIDCYADGALHPAVSPWSATKAVDAIAGAVPVFASDEVSLSYSPKWAEGGSRAVVTVKDALGNLETLHDEKSGAEGAVVWNAAAREDGRYELTHAIYGASGETLGEETVALVVNRDVAAHGGRLAASETWGADKVHVVLTTVVVGEGVTLTIEPGALVKFMTGTGVVLEDGGAGTCDGIVATHAYDDVAGGDSFLDGTATAPAFDGYSFNGPWSGALAERRYVGSWSPSQGYAEELRARIGAKLSSAEYAEFYDLATLCGFTARELNMVESPEVRLAPELKIGEFSPLTGGVLKFSFENGIDASPLDAVQRLQAAQGVRIVLVERETLGGDEVRTELHCVADASGNMEVSLPEVLSSGGGSRFYSVAVERAAD